MAFDRTAQYQAYNMASQTAPKTRQIVMLYDGAIRFMQQAKQAIEENRIEDRFNLLSRVSEILIGLQGCLDFEQGGEIAQILYNYYSSLDARVLSIHRSQSADMCDRVIADLKEMRDAWVQIDTGSESNTATPPSREEQERAASQVQSSVQVSV